MSRTLLGRRALLRRALTVVAAPALAACAARVSPVAAHSESAYLTVRFARGYSPTSDSLVAAYYAKNSNVRILDVQQMGDPTALLRSGKADVGMPFGGEIPGLVSGKLIQDLDPYLREANLDQSPFGGLLDAMRYQGGLYDLPFDASAQVIVYNRDMFQSAGLPVPAPGWTWDDFRRSARALVHDGDAGRVWGFSDQYPQQLVQLWLGQTGPGPVVGSAPSARDLEAALRLFYAMIFTDKSMPAQPVHKPGQPFFMGPQTDFRDGKAAMALANTGGNLQFVSGGAKFHWDIAPVPAQPGASPELTIQVDSMAIAANSKVADAAWNFLLFAAGPDGAAAAAHAGQLPVYRTPAAQKAWLASQGGAAGAVALLPLPYRLGPRFPSGPQAPGKVLQAASQAETAVLSGQEAVDAAIAAYRAAGGV